MKLMITGDKLRIEKVSERKDEPSAREWLSNKARRQRRDANGRFAGGKGHAPRTVGSRVPRDRNRCDNATFVCFVIAGTRDACPYQ